MNMSAGWDMASPGYWHEDEAGAQMNERLLGGFALRPIALAGFMGVGKSSVGALLADALGLKFFDVDHVIEERCAMSVQDLFAERGEPEFRALERSTVGEILDKGRSVIALGGGAFVDSDTREMLLKRSLVIHLHLPWREMRGVIESLDQGRPVLQGKTLAQIYDLYLQRLHAYREAHFRVTVPRTSPEEGARSVMEILERLQESSGHPPGSDGSVDEGIGGVP